VPDPCPACADLRGRLDRVLCILALARWYTGMGDDVAALPGDLWREAVNTLAPPAEGAAPAPDAGAPGREGAGVP
jgi:hypothetical protein